MDADGDGDGHGGGTQARKHAALFSLDGPGLKRRKEEDKRELFRFKTFAEELTRIDISITGARSYTEDAAPVSGSFFHDALLKWKVTDLSAAFNAFYREVRGISQSLELVLVNKGKILEELEKSLIETNSMAAPALLDLLVHLARDLRKHFYAHFIDTVFNTLVLVVSPGTRVVIQPAIIESTFRTLTYCFKFLQKQIQKDLDRFYGTFKSVFSPGHPEFVRHFAAESYAFVLRKLPDAQLGSHLDVVFRELGAEEEPSDELQDGLTQLVFETVRHVQHQLHSKTPVLLKHCLTKLEQPEEFGPALENVLAEALGLVVMHVRKRDADSLWPTVTDHCAAVAQRWNDGGDGAAVPAAALAATLRVVCRAMARHEGGKVTTAFALAGHAVVGVVLDGDIPPSEVAPELLEAAVELQTALAMFNPSALPIAEVAQRILRAGSSSSALAFAGGRDLCLHGVLDDEQTAAFLTFACGHLKWEHRQTTLPKTLLFVADVAAGEADGSAFTSDRGVLEAVLLAATAVLKKALKSKQPDLSVVWGCQLIIFRLGLESVKTLQVLQDSLAHVSKLARTLKDQAAEPLLYVLAGAIYALGVAVTTGSDNAKLVTLVTTHVQAHPSSASVLRAYHTFVQQLQRKTEGGVVQTAAAITDVLMPSLRVNVGSSSMAVRLVSLEVMVCVPQYGVGGACDVFRRCLEAEHVEPTLEGARVRELALQKMGSAAYIARLPADLMDIPIRYLLATLTVPLAIVWETARTLLAGYAERHGEELWPLLLERLVEANRRCRGRRQDAEAEVDDTIGQLWNDSESPAMSEVASKLVADLAAETDESRVDPSRWHTELCKLLAALPPLTERHNRDVVPLFLDFMANEYDRVFTGSATRQDLRNRAHESADHPRLAKGDDAEKDDEDDDADEHDDNTVPERSKRALSKRLLDYLGVFVKFHNPSEAHRGSELEKVYYNLLLRWDQRAATQVAALQCIFQYRSRELMPYKEELTQIVQEGGNFKDQLVKFSLAEDGGVVAAQHRSGVLKVLARVLIAKMMARNRKGKGHTDPKARRRLVLRFFASCPPSDIDTFVQHLFEPFETELSLESAPDPQAAVPLKKQLGFLNLLIDLLDTLGRAIVGVIDQAMNITIRMVHDVEGLLARRDELASSHVNVLKSIRILGTKRIADVLLAFPTIDHSRFKSELEQMVLKRPLEYLRNESAQQPSPLLRFALSCSNDRRLFHYLRALDDTMLPAIFGLLSIPDVSDDVMDAVLTISENLLLNKRAISDDDDDDDEADAAMEEVEGDLTKSVIYPHVQCLLSHLPPTMIRRLRISRAVKPGERPTTGFTTLQLSVLSRIAPFAQDAVTAIPLVELLLPHLEQPNLLVPERDKVLILETACSAARKFGGPSGDANYRFLSSLLHTLWSSTLRLKVCDLFAAHAEHDATAAAVAPILGRLNAVAQAFMGDDDVDYDTRTAAFAEVHDTLLPKLTPKELLPIVYCYLFFCSRKEVALRNNAADGLIAMILRLAEVTDLKPITDDTVTPGAEHALLLDVLLPAVKGGLKSRTEAVRNQYIHLLETFVVTFPACTDVQELGTLRNTENEEQDFFLNIRHIQAHRRMRALRQAGLAIANNEMSTVLIVDVLVPLANNFIIGDPDREIEYNLSITALEVISASCTAVPWTAYLAILQRYLWLMASKKQNEKTKKLLLRAVLAVLDGFHFKIAPSNNREAVAGTADAEASASASTADPAMVVDGASEGAAAAPVPDLEVSKAEIIKTITKTILPKLYKYLTVKSESEKHKGASLQVLRPQVALAIVKVLLRLPKYDMDSKLPQLFTRVTGVLRDRLESSRDGARVCLGEIVKQLGPEYFGPVLRELTTGLSRGFQLHVLGYTVNHCLQCVADQCTVGSLDNVVEQLIPVFVDDIFGTVAEEKDTEAIQNKHKEARKATSYSSFTIVARFTSPSRADELILNPLRDAMSTSSSSKITGKLREILRCAVIGFNSHGAEVADHMLHLAEGCVKGALPKSQQGNIVTKPGASATATSIYIVPPEKRKKGAEAYFNTNAHLLVEMGLGLLVHLCRQNKLDLGEDGRHSAELNAAVPTVVDCLHSKYNRVMVLALQFFTVVLPRCEGMPDVKGATNHVAKRVFKLIRRSGASSATVDLNRACFATAAVIVRHCPWFEMSEGHVRVLLSFVQADLEVDDKQKNAFQVLKSVLARKVLAVEVYDTVDMVLEILVRAASPAARKMARSAVLQFLLDYPLGKKRLDKTLNYLVSNLDFELDGGRESALLMLESVVVRFPDAILAEYAELFFLSVAKQLVNVSVPVLREAGCQLVAALVQRVTPAMQDTMHEMAIRWAENDADAIRRTSAQLLGIFIDEMGKGYVRHASQSAKILVASIERLAAEVSAEASEGPDWEQLYMTLVTLEKLFKTFPAELRLTPIPFWEAVQTCLLHSHEWVRLASARLFGVYFADDAMASDAEGFIAQDGCLIELSKLFCQQLEEAHVSAPLSQQLLKNLFFIGKRLYTEYAIGMAEGALGEPDGEPVQVRNGTAWTFKQLGYVARMECANKAKQSVRRECAFKWFAAMVDACPTCATAFLDTILEPLYRTEESFGSTVELKDLGAQVQTLVKGVVGSSAYFAAHNRVRDKVAMVRLGRKRDRKLEGVRDPTKAAERKIKKQVNKRDSRKRKVTRLREEDGRPKKPR